MVIACDCSWRRSLRHDSQTIRHMNKFSFHPEADEEFVEAVAYYEDCESGLGLDFAREVHAAIQNARDYPTLWPQIEDDVRRCLVHRFPYGVLYSAETHGIFILKSLYCSM
jgi:toxin ParE1/3/4